MTGAGSIDDVFIAQLGPQFNYYLFGSFDGGIQLGAEVLGLYGSASEGDISSSAQAVSPSAYVGLKSTLSFGLTFVTQLGYSFLALSGEATDGFGTSSTDSNTDHFPLLRINLGWSF